MNRGFHDKNFWVMETAPGVTNWLDRNYTMPKGEVRAMALQAVAHGADGYAFWTWRPALGRTAIAGTEPVAEVAMLHDFTSRWAIKRQPMTIDYDPFVLFTDFYRATKPNVGGIAVIAQAASRALQAGRRARAQPRRRSRGQGADRLCPRRRSPRARSARPGEERGQHVAATRSARTDRALGDAWPATATIWAERLAVDRPNVDILLRYPARDWLDPAPAVVTRAVGKDRITYVGAWLDPAGLSRTIAWAAAQAVVRPLLAGVPDGIEVTARGSGARRLVVAINWALTPQTLILPGLRRDLLSGTRAARFALDPYGVVVLATP